MKTHALSLLFLGFPFLASADIALTLKKVDAIRLENGGCTFTDEEITQVETAFSKVGSRGKKGQFVATKALADLKLARSSCTSSDLEEEKALISSIKAYEPSFPAGILVPYTTIEAERAQNEEALAYLKSRENTDCEAIRSADLYSPDKWHATLVTSGWKCIADNYISLSQELNESMGHEDAQKTADDLKALKLPELKRLFKETFKDELNSRTLKVALVPHLSWENGALNTVFPYSLFLKKTELTTYKFLVKELKKLGVPSVFIERNSLNPLEKQVRETKEGLLKLKDKHIVISRSMGARVMREIIADNDASVNEKMKAYFNIGGTPHGSVIAKAKISPDNFYRGTALGIADVFKLPLGIITKDPRLPDHLQETLFSALDRNNLATMVPVEARQITESRLPVLNAVFMRNDYERAAPLVDPVWKHMLEQGPTEGSSPLVGAAVDTSNSMRIIMDSDHLAFWKYTPKEGLEIYLRLLITAKRSGLI